MAQFVITVCTRSYFHLSPPFFPAIAMMKTPVYPFYDIMPAVSPSVTGLACVFAEKGSSLFSSATRRMVTEFSFCLPLGEAGAL